MLPAVQIQAVPATEGRVGLCIMTQARIADKGSGSLSPILCHTAFINPLEGKYRIADCI